MKPHLNSCLKEYNKFVTSELKRKYHVHNPVGPKLYCLLTISKPMKTRRPIVLAI